MATKKKKDVTKKKVTETKTSAKKTASKAKSKTTKSENPFLKDTKKLAIIGVVALVVIIGAVAGYAIIQGNEKSKVEEAVKLHIQYYNDRNIDAYYDLVSQDSKNKFEITLDDIANLLNKASFDGTNITLVNISQITIQGDNAEVRGVITVKNNQETKTSSFVEFYKKENGEWKYEQRTWATTQTSQIPQQ